ncbi:hypothetical protein F4777DRAFT_560417 [Nemania sp. FL0916]|nr:hypothetical protein F4777DRAFT_560417 [Nemania sp. FL0916]
MDLNLMLMQIVRASVFMKLTTIVTFWYVSHYPTILSWLHCHQTSRSRCRSMFFKVEWIVARSDILMALYGFVVIQKGVTG